MDCDDQMMSDHERRSNGSGISATNAGSSADHRDDDVNNKVGRRGRRKGSEKMAAKIPSSSLGPARGKVRLKSAVMGHGMSGADVLVYEL